MTASAMWVSARDDSRATLEILYRMAGASPPPAAEPSLEHTTSLERTTAPPSPVRTSAGSSIVRRRHERRRGRGCRGHLKVATPAPQVAARAPAPDSFFSKPPVPRAAVATTLSVPAMSLGMPPMARWLRTTALVYAGSMTAALIAGTALWPR